MTSVSSFVCLRHSANSLMAMSFFVVDNAIMEAWLFYTFDSTFSFFKGAILSCSYVLFLHVFVYKYFYGENCSFYICGHGFEVEALSR